LTFISFKIWINHKFLDILLFYTYGKGRGLREYENFEIKKISGYLDMRNIGMEDIYIGSMKIFFFNLKFMLNNYCSRI